MRRAGQVVEISLDPEIAILEINVNSHMTRIHRRIRKMSPFPEVNNEDRRPATYVKVHIQFQIVQIAVVNMAVT